MWILLAAKLIGYALAIVGVGAALVWLFRRAALEEQAEIDREADAAFRTRFNREQAERRQDRRVGRAS